MCEASGGTLSWAFKFSSNFFFFFEGGVVVNNLTDDLKQFILKEIDMEKIKVM